MAITGQIFNSLTFGGINSADYGIYITGTGAFDAPKRSVNMVSIPGRNGALVVDQGHWDNVTVEYPAGVFGDDIDDFREAISNFRNAILSQIGYQRLTDTYHPDEYRMATYIDGLEVDPAAHNSAGEFTLKFNCKPQRWLTSGETAVTVTSGDVLTNPTPYAASPLLTVTGYGSLDIGDASIIVSDDPLGVIPLSAGEYWKTRGSTRLSETSIADVALALLDTGDKFTVTGAIVELSFSLGLEPIDSATPTSQTTGDINAYTSNVAGLLTVIVEQNPQTFTKGTAATKYGRTAFEITARGGGLGLAPIIGVDIKYDGAETITIQVIHNDYRPLTINNCRFGYKLIEGDSTLNIQSVPANIDLDSGEVYGIVANRIVDLNKNVAMPTVLPKLESGETEIAFDNTITQLTVTPRWWKL